MDVPQTLSRGVGIQRAMCKGRVVSFLAVQVTTLIYKVKALTETSTAVGAVRAQLHSPCLMSFDLDLCMQFLFCR